MPNHFKLGSKSSKMEGNEVFSPKINWSTCSFAPLWIQAKPICSSSKQILTALQLEELAKDKASFLLQGHSSLHWKKEQKNNYNNNNNIIMKNQWIIYTCQKINMIGVSCNTRNR